jgi:type IV pilus assembly protein PilV
VAVAVLSIGLLGLAGLQVSGLRLNHSAYLRTQATLLAYELADRMRANRIGFNAGNYHNPTAAQINNCRAVAGCTPAEMAQNDVWEWQQALARLLPGGQGLVCRDTIPIEAASVPGDAANCDDDPDVNTYAIKTWWNDRDPNDPTQLSRFVVTFTR